MVHEFACASVYLPRQRGSIGMEECDRLSGDLEYHFLLVVPKA